MSLLIVSGCPRSGTSLTMNLIKEIVGEDKMIGYKFPSIEVIKSTIENTNNKDIKRYLTHLYQTKDRDKNKQMVNMNPRGFWEDGRFSVQGLTYNQSTKGIIREVKNKNIFRFAKIVSSGLNSTTPEYINKIVYLIRDPFEVAKSQEKLRRNSRYKDDTGKEIDILEGITINTPIMFIQSVISWARFVIDNPDIPIIYIKHQELLSEPISTISDLVEFIKSDCVDINTSSVDKALKIIDSSLYRSKVNDIPKEGIWFEAFKMYSFLLSNNPVEALKFINNPKLVYNRTQTGWLCSRARFRTVEAHCKECRKNKIFRESLKKRGERSGAVWENEPCAYEVAYDLDNEHISIEESIKNNFWKE